MSLEEMFYFVVLYIAAWWWFTRDHPEKEPTTIGQDLAALGRWAQKQIEKRSK